MHLGRPVLLAIARTRATMQVERAAAITEMQREFAAEASAIRQEMADARRELAAVRNELRGMNVTTAEELKVLDEQPFITAIIASLQAAVDVATPLGVAVALVRTARALGGSSPEDRCFLALEMLAVASQLDPDAVSARWQ
jgi:hypothetical protein